MNEEQLQALLRARAKVEMPAEYPQKLLESLHERQRSVLLQKPLWRIACERLETFLSEHSLSTPAYALGVAAVLAVGLAAIALLKPAPSGSVMAHQKGGVPPSMSAPVETQAVNFEKPPK
jgi:hypothetical protein